MAFPVSTRATDDLITAAIWNADIVANMNAVARPIPKTADETVTSSTVLQNDDHLLFAMAANEYYSVRGCLWVSTGGSGDFKTAFTVPASATYHIEAMGYDASAATFQHSQQRSVGDVIAWQAGSTGNIVVISGVVVCAGTAGNFQLQWAQNASDGTGTILKKGSHLVISKLG